MNYGKYDSSLKKPLVYLHALESEDVHHGLPSSLITELRDKFTLVSTRNLTDEPETASRIEAAIVIRSRVTYFRSWLERLTKLKVVGTYSMGVDHLKSSLDYFKSKHIRVCHTPDVASDSTADLGFGLLLATAGGIVSSRHSTLKNFVHKFV